MDSVEERILDPEHFCRIAEKCAQSNKNERGEKCYSQYILKGENKLLLYLDKKSGRFREVVSRDGSFSDHPGIEYDRRWTAYFEYPEVEKRVRYEAYIVKQSEEKHLFLWTIQPYYFDPGDEYGFGMESQPEIRLYSYLDRNGSFTAPFRLYSVGGYCYYPDM